MANHINNTPFVSPQPSPLDESTFGALVLQLLQRTAHTKVSLRLGANVEATLDNFAAQVCTLWTFLLPATYI